MILLTVLIIIILLIQVTQRDVFIKTGVELSVDHQRQQLIYIDN
jgi:hypothetical protein